MKKIILLIALLIIVPVSANAMTEEEMKEKLDIIPFKTIDGKKYLETKIIDPDIMMGSKLCNNVADVSQSAYEKYIAENPDAADSTFDEWKAEQEQYNDEENAICKQEFYSGALVLYLKSIGLNLSWEYMFNFTDKTHATIEYSDYSDEENTTSYSYDVTITYANSNESEFTSATKKLNSFDDNYSNFGINLFSSIYHYGWDMYTYPTKLMLSRYPELKKIIEPDASNYDYEIQLNNAGGAPYTASFESVIGIFKNGVLYNVRKVKLCDDYIIYVDKDLAGTAFEKAEKRIKEYFDNKIDITVSNPEGWSIDDENISEVLKFVNDKLGTTNQNYNLTAAQIKYGTNKTQEILIVEIDKEKLDNLIIKSYDYETGVNVSTSSYDVPVDATITVTDVKTEEYVKEALKGNNLEVISAYDITLSKMNDGTLIRTIENGIEVYLPVDDSYKGNAEVDVYYLKSDATIGEILKGKVVKIDGKLYVKFTTTHFSTYALANTIKDETSTPTEPGEETQEKPDNDQNEDNTPTESGGETQEKPDNDQNEDSTPTESEEETSSDKTSNEETKGNPKTFDGIGTSIFMGIISLIGLICVTVYFKKIK